MNPSDNPQESGNTSPENPEDSRPEDWWDGMTDQEVENWIEGSD